MATQTIPLDWYVSPAILEREKQMLARLPQYRGHVSMVPNLHDSYTIASTDHAEMLVHNKNGFELLSNVCRHRQVVMLQGCDHHSKIVCPGHCWTYDKQGKLLQAPHFKENPHLDLTIYEKSIWNGMVFKGKDDVASDITSSRVNEIFDFSNYSFDQAHNLDCPYNWKVFIDTYLDSYHINVIHPGLRSFMDCSQIEWILGDKYCAQIVKMNPNWRKQGGTDVYRHVQELLKEISPAEEPPFAAVWMLVYPNVMVEHYPHAIVVSVVNPVDVTHTKNRVEFYHPTELVKAKHPYCQAFQNAYLETAKEDDQMCERIQRGLAHSVATGVNSGGPSQTPFEDGVPHFHHYLRKAMHRGKSSIRVA